MNIKSFVAVMFAAALTLGFTSCKKTPVVTDSISVNPETLAFAAEGGESTVSVSASGAWHVTATSGAWFTLDVTESNYSSAVKVSVSENTTVDTPRNGSVTFTCGKKSAVLSISQEGASRPLPNEIYSIDFTKGFGDFTVEDKVHPSEIAQVWTNSNQYGAVASGYNDQNKQNYETEGWLISPEVDLEGYKYAFMNFNHAANMGAGALTDYLKLMSSTDGGKTWKELAIPVMPSGSNWTYVDSGDIDLREFCGRKVQFAFAYKSTVESSYKWEIKSVNVFRDPKDNGSTYTTVPAWMELPKVEDKSNFVIHTSLVDDGYVRNFSLLNDPKALVALWVAYPQCDYYMKKVSDRTNLWGYDPFIDKDKQPNLNKSGDFFANGYERGHQIASADRLVSTHMNSQTFYYSNMAPMLKQKEFNSGVWSTLEDKVRDWSRSYAHTDTMYVVTGSVVAGSKTFVKDNDGKQVTVPVGFYKALLRYSKSDANTPQYIGSAFYFEHRNYSMETDFKPYAMSIDALEEKLGMDFFPNLESVIGKEEAAKVEAEDPKANQFWWNN